MISHPHPQSRQVVFNKPVRSAWVQGMPTTKREPLESQDDPSLCCWPWDKARQWWLVHSTASCQNSKIRKHCWNMNLYSVPWILGWIHITTRINQQRLVLANVIYKAFKHVLLEHEGKCIIIWMLRAIHVSAQCFTKITINVMINVRKALLRFLI